MTAERDSYFVYNLGSPSTAGLGRVGVYFWRQDCEEKAIASATPTYTQSNERYIPACERRWRGALVQQSCRVARGRLAAGGQQCVVGSSSRPRPAPHAAFRACARRRRRESRRS